MSEQETEGTETLRSFLVPDGPHYTVAVPEHEYEALCAAEARVRVLEARIKTLEKAIKDALDIHTSPDVGIGFTMGRIRDKIQAALKAVQGPEQQEAG